MSNIVAIVGRPNVGKSTLFNRLVESKQAIVDNQSGVTRDRHYGTSEWIGTHFTVIDTGGYVSNSTDVFEVAIREQVDIAIEEASVIIFMVDIETGITDLDDQMARILRKGKKPVMLVANKADNYERIHDAQVFHRFGFKNFYSLSAMSGSGTGELLDDVVAHLEKDAPEEINTLPKYCVVGRPNVGKSSFINTLLEKERNIVTPIAGTTRDAVYETYNKFGHEFILIDTAGLRRKTKVHENLEFYSVMRTIRAIEASDVCILMIDATQGLDSQDVNIFSLAIKNKKGVVILVNKWDLVEKDTKTSLEFEKKIKEKLMPFTDVPIIFTSVTEKQRIHKALEASLDVYTNLKKRIPTSKLNDILLPIIANFPPPSSKGKYIKIKYITQLHANTPTFAFFCNHTQYFKEAYIRFLENQIRDNFDFKGSPVNIYFREK